MLFIEEHTDTLLEQTKTKPQQTLEFEQNKQNEPFSFNPPINLFEERQWLLAVTNFEAGNCVFNITDENNSFSVSTLSHWSSRGEAETINRLHKLLRVRSQNDIELHEKKVQKKSLIITQKKFPHLISITKSDILGKLKNEKNNDLEGIVFRLELTYGEITEILVIKNTPTISTGYGLPPSIYEINDLNIMIKTSLLDDAKVDITIDDIRLRSKLTTKKTIKFTEKSFFYTILGFTQSHPSPLNDPFRGYNQFIAGKNKNEKPKNTIGNDKIHLKCDCNNGSILKGVTEPFLFTFALDKPSSKFKNTWNPTF